MSQINCNPSAHDLSELARGIKYNNNCDTLETWSAINSTAAVNCSTLSVSNGIFTSSVTAPTITSSIFMTAANSTMNMMSGVSINGDLTFTTPKSYATLYENMMKAVYGAVAGKDQEFCMPSSKSKMYLGQLINHMNDHDAEKCLRALYYVVSQMPMGSEHLPSQPITTSILEFAVKEDL